MDARRKMVVGDAVDFLGRCRRGCLGAADRAATVGIADAVGNTSDNRLLEIALADDGETSAAIGSSNSARFHEGRVFFWDARTLKPQTTWGNLRPSKTGTGTELSYALTLSPDGSKVALRPTIYSLTADAFAVFDRTTQRELWRISGSFAFACAHFSPDGRTLGVTRRAKAGVEFLLLNASDGRVIGLFQQPTPTLADGKFVWSPDGKLVAFVSSVPILLASAAFVSAPALIQIRRADDGKLLYEWNLKAPSIENLSFSPDGRSLAVITTRRSNTQKACYELVVADTKTGREQWKFKNYTENRSDWSLFAALRGGLYSPDGKTIAVLSDAPGTTSLKNPLLLDSETGAIKRELKLGSNDFSMTSASGALAWAPDSKRLYARGGSAVLVWDLD